MEAKQQQHKARSEQEEPVVIHAGNVKVAMTFAGETTIDEAIANYLSARRAFEKATVALDLSPKEKRTTVA